MKGKYTLRIVFMGTPDFAVPCLKALIDSNHEVCGVYTQPDKPKGRGYKLAPPPVKVVALDNGIEVYQPISLKKGDEAINAIKTLREQVPDLIVVTAYGKILPKEVLDLPQYGCINIHASLLPKYRGAAPIQWSVVNGDKVTGITSMQMAEGLDTGDMLVKKELEIGENETSSELHDRLSELGASVLMETVSLLEKGELVPIKQDDSQSCYAEMIKREMTEIDFGESAHNIHNRIRGLTGMAYLNGKRIKMFRSHLVDMTGEIAGEIIDSKNFVIACGDGHCIQIDEVQAEGSKRMRSTDFLRGNKIQNGMTFDRK